MVRKKGSHDSIGQPPGLSNPAEQLSIRVDGLTEIITTLCNRVGAMELHRKATASISRNLHVCSRLEVAQVGPPAYGKEIMDQDANDVWERIRRIEGLLLIADFDIFKNVDNLIARVREGELVQLEGEQTQQANWEENERPLHSLHANSSCLFRGVNHRYTLC